MYTAIILLRKLYCKVIDICSIDDILYIFEQVANAYTVEPRYKEVGYNKTLL